MSWYASVISENRFMSFTYIWFPNKQSERPCPQLLGCTSHSWRSHFLCEEGLQKVSKNIEQPLTKSNKINQNHYQNHSKPIPFHWQFQCIFGAHPQTLDLHKGLMMLDAEARKAPFLIVSPFSSYVAFESFRCLWVFLEFLQLIQLILNYCLHLSPHFFHSFFPYICWSDSQ